MSLTYKQAINYLYENLPMFQRIGAVAFKKDLTNTKILCSRLGDPQTKFPSIHVGGTNGKGSSSHMLAAILQTAGYKTGLYTSPHLKSFTERIRVNGEEVPQEFVIDFVERIRPVVEEIKPSFFEITVAMAFDYFARQKVDVAVIEVGLGGRLDSTNIITPLLSLITNISWDHKDLLGDTLEAIAGEKAGIIKPSVPAVISLRQPSVEAVFETKATQTGSTLVFASDLYHVEVLGNGKFFAKSENQYLELELDLKGDYQKFNLPGVLASVDELRKQGFLITDQQVTQALQHVAKLTGLKGRWQKLNDEPLVICDTGHNEDGVRQVVKQIQDQKYNHLHMVWGSVKDKDISSILAQLPKDAAYYFCEAKIPRAMPAQELSRLAANFGLKGSTIPDVNEALREAMNHSQKNDFVFVGGSTFVVAELENL